MASKRKTEKCAKNNTCTSKGCANKTSAGNSSSKSSCTKNCTK